MDSGSKDNEPQIECFCTVAAVPDQAQPLKISVQVDQMGPLNALVNSFLGIEDRAVSVIPVAEPQTALGQAQQGAFMAQAEALQRSLTEKKSMDDSITPAPPPG